MPKIADIEGTPNPNAMKFILKEPLTWGMARSYDNAEQAKGDPLAEELFAIEHVTNVFYVDRWITVTQDGGADWKELTRQLAVPIRAAPAADAQSAAAVAAASSAIADLSADDQQRLDISMRCSTSRYALICKATAATCTCSASRATGSPSTTRALAAPVRARSRARLPASSIW